MEISFISLLVKTVLEFFIEGQEAAYRPGDFNPNFITFFRHTHTKKLSDMSPNTKRQEKAFHGSPPSFLKTSCSDRPGCSPPLCSGLPTTLRVAPAPASPHQAGQPPASLPSPLLPPHLHPPVSQLFPSPNSSPDLITHGFVSEAASNLLCFI